MPIINMATAFVLTIRMENGKWQSVNLESCVTGEQQGFICESNTIEAQDICFDTEQGICHFEIHPNTSQKNVLVYVGKGCVCLRTACDFVEIDKENITLHSKNHSNFVFVTWLESSAVIFYIWHQWYPTS